MLLRPFPIQRPLKPHTILQSNQHRHHLLTPEILHKAVVGLQRGNQQTAAQLQVQLLVPRREISPWPVYRLVSPVLNHLPLRAHFLKPLCRHEKILPAVFLPLPHGTGRIRHNPLQIQSFLPLQQTENGILAAGAFSH